MTFCYKTIPYKQAFISLIFLVFPIASAYSQRRAEVLPTPEQIKWADAELGVIIHLDINIFAPDTFDYAKKETLPDVSVFNPKKLNTDQWIRTAKAAGAKYALLTVKHGTGFGLWPSAVNTYNVGHTPWRNGKADILKEFLTSCRKYGIKPGLYYNTNTNTYYDAGRKPFASDSDHRAYNKAVLKQLSELWGNYGPMFEIWFDGGLLADEKNGMESQVLRLVQQKQPQAILFQGPLSTLNTIRWIGNEDGIAAYPQWSRSDATTASDGTVKINDLHGNPNGEFWCPGESDFPIRKNYAWNGGWLWKAGEDKDLFEVNELVDKYNKSVGRNTNMLIGVVIDTNGLVPRADSLVFDRFGKKIKSLFANPVIVKTNLRQAVTQMIIPAGKKVNQLVITEDIAKGEHIRSYRLDAWVADKWKEVLSGQSVGHKRIQAFVSSGASKYKLTITKSEGIIHIKELALYAAE